MPKQTVSAIRKSMENETFISLFESTERDIHARLGESGESYLHIASSLGRMDVVNFLLGKGANPNIECSLMQLREAVERNEIDKIKPLLEAARYLIINTPVQKNGLTAVHLATSKEMLQCLMSFGAKTDVLNKHGQSILHRMACANNLGMVEQLVQTAPELIHKKDKAGQTPLQGAVLAGHKDVVEMLLDHRADWKDLNEKKQTVLHLAAKHGQVDIVDILLKRGAKADCTDKNGKTPGMLSCNPLIKEKLACPAKEATEAPEAASSSSSQGPTLFRRKVTTEITNGDAFSNAFGSSFW